MNGKQISKQTALLLAGLLLISSGLSSCKGRGTSAGEDSQSVSGADTKVPAEDGTSASEVPTASPEEPGTDTVEPETAPEIVPADGPTVGEYDKKCDASITLSGSGAECAGGGVTITGSVVTITASGTYLLTGSLDGQLVVDVPDGAEDGAEDKTKVKLIMNGVSVKSPDGPALLVKSAPGKVILYSAAGSVNLFEDGDGYIVPDEQQTEGGLYPNACIYACADLKLDGEGSISVTGRADKGINTKDDLLMAGGTVTVTSPGTAVRGNDSFRMTGGSLTVTVTGEGDGVKTANVEKEGKGTLSVEDGSLFVTSIGDALSAATDLSVTGGHIVITTLDAGGKALKEASASSGGSRGGFGPGGMEGNANKSSISAKGLKAGGTVTVAGGKLTITAADDGIHADDKVVIRAGELWIRAGDDGMHADNELTISGGVTEIAQSYEGLEAIHINILGGTNRVTASDDGMNACGGTSMGGPGGGGGGMFGPGGPGGRPGGPGGRPGDDGRGGQGGTSGTEDSGETPLLTIAGGYTIINANGDGIDSNGNIVMTGGELYVFGPTDNGNGPIDYGDGNCSMTISGGTLLAVGSSGMAESPTNAGQAVFSTSFRTTLKAGMTVGLCGADGHVLCAFELPKAIQSFVYSSPLLVSGETYSLVYNGEAASPAVDGILDPDEYDGFREMGTAKAN